MKDNDRDTNQLGVVVQFPTTPEIAARRYELELERVARLDYASALAGGPVKLHRVSPRVRKDYFRLCGPHFSRRRRDQPLSQ